MFYNIIVTHVQLYFQFLEVKQDNIHLDVTTEPSKMSSIYMTITQKNDSWISKPIVILDNSEAVSESSSWIPLNITVLITLVRK